MVSSIKNFPETSIFYTGIQKWNKIKIIFTSFARVTGAQRGRKYSEINGNVFPERSSAESKIKKSPGFIFLGYTWNTQVFSLYYVFCSFLDYKQSSKNVLYQSRVLWSMWYFIKNTEKHYDLFFCNPRTSWRKYK